MAKCRRNVENFLEACKKIGVPQVTGLLLLSRGGAGGSAVSSLATYSCCLCFTKDTLDVWDMHQAHDGCIQLDGVL